MNTESVHSFHIPVMGLAFTIDTPLKVARFGISSVVSIISDSLVEEVRKFYTNKEKSHFIPISLSEIDSRAKRITAYLNYLGKTVSGQIEKLRSEAFEAGKEIYKYFELLPEKSPLKILFDEMKGIENIESKNMVQEYLRSKIVHGAIDVNIMAKVDKTNYSKTGDDLSPEFSDAMSALRGFAKSELNSSVVFSAGMNPRLYSYCETFSDFFPDLKGNLKKKITLKVSDYRSAYIQGKFLAKKGLWVSEYRIESGLNCGGHAFATDGFLLGPILEEFKLNKKKLSIELFAQCNEALKQKNKITFINKPSVKITVQGGIGTSNESDFLREYYEVDSTGWGSPFLLVPEVTNVDEETLNLLCSAKKEDYYLSNASPLGIMFNNFKKSSANVERKERIAKGRPGSPCPVKYLKFNTEFTEKPICTASRQYQNLKIKQLQSQDLSEEELAKQISIVTEKECICSGLSATVFLKNGIPVPNKANAVSICPGPNLSFFSGIFSLREMVDHIYGRKNLLNKTYRPNIFINELNLYIDYLRNKINNSMETISALQSKYYEKFRENLIEGINYYKAIADKMANETESYRENFKNELLKIENKLKSLELNAAQLILLPV